MKRLFAFAVAVFTLTAVSAQSNVERNVNYYGLDFSKTRTFGAEDIGWEFKGVFIRLNSLVVTEWNKYDPGRYLGRTIDLIDISATELVNDAIEPAEISTSSSRYALSDDDIAGMVRRYDLQESEGTGLVILGEVLNKSAMNGSFIVVYFDIASREVLASRRITGKARGFGLRNYWAGALYSALRARY